jgi:hypothetical protein
MVDPVAPPAQAGVVVPQEVAQLGYSQMELRKKIALAMMARSRSKGYPKNIGEGLTAIGDSLGDIGLMHSLERQQAEMDEQRRRQMDEAPPPPPAPPLSPAGM